MRMKSSHEVSKKNYYHRRAWLSLDVIECAEISGPLQQLQSDSIGVILDQLNCEPDQTCGSGPFWRLSALKYVQRVRTLYARGTLFQVRSFEDAMSHQSRYLSV
eukprot:scaffold137389_cov55-Attheya_sp.AAC.1